MKFSLLISFIFTVYASVLVASGTSATSKFVLTSDVKWGPLNPARSDKGPKAGNLWGDRTGSGPSGFLVKFEEGFSSPPHIHNISYRGTVISGLVHNDNPNAKEMWLPTSSYWTQPAGEVHITSAKANNNLAYIEIEDGPYLVLPAEEAFDNGERPINVDASNIVWLEQPKSIASANKVEFSYLWGKPTNNQLYGALIKIHAGSAKNIRSFGSQFHAVVIEGPLQYHVAKSGVKILHPGSYFNSNKETIHKISNNNAEDIIIYVRTNGVLEFGD